MAPRVAFASDEQTRKYNQLKGLQVRSSRYPHFRTMEDLGIAEDVITLFQRIGWGHMMEARWPTYPALVYEFLASLKVNDETAPKEPLGISFQLRNQEYYLTRNELDTILQCPVDGTYFYHEDFNPVEFWQAIAADAPFRPTNFHTSLCKASSIDNPVFRYIHRALAVSVFGHHEMGKVRFFDMYTLWCMLSGTPISMAAQVMDTWKRQASATAGRIWCGGLITPIALYYGVNMGGLEPSPNPTELDRAQLVQMQMLAAGSADTFLRMSNGDLFRLPHPELTHVTDLEFRDNWWMHMPQHLAVCRTPDGRPSTSRLTPRPGLPQYEAIERAAELREEQQQEPPHMEQQMPDFTQEAGPSGSQPDYMAHQQQQFGSSYASSMSADQWGMIQSMHEMMQQQLAFNQEQQAFNLRQEEYHVQQQQQLQQMQQMMSEQGARMEAMNKRMNDLTIAANAMHGKQQREIEDARRARARDDQFYSYIRSHPRLFYPQDPPVFRRTPSPPIPVDSSSDDDNPAAG